MIGKLGLLIRDNRILLDRSNIQAGRERISSPVSNQGDGQVVHVGEDQQLQQRSRFEAGDKRLRGSAALSPVQVSSKRSTFESISSPVTGG